jgi:hypothetical protein
MNFENQKVRLEIVEDRVKIGGDSRMYIETVQGADTISFSDYDKTLYIDLDDLHERQRLRIVEPTGDNFEVEVSEINTQEECVYLKI